VTTAKHIIKIDISLFFSQF